MRIALDTPDLRSRLRAHSPNRTLACISRTRHARSPQRVARAETQSHSRLHFAHSTRTISAEGCANRPNHTLACISRTRHTRSPQRVAREQTQSHSRLHFAHSTRTISAEGCACTDPIALSPAFRAGWYMFGCTHPPCSFLNPSVPAGAHPPLVKGWTCIPPLEAQEQQTPVKAEAPAQEVQGVEEEKWRRRRC